MVNQFNLIISSITKNLKIILICVAIIMFLYIFIKFKGLRTLMVIALIIVTIVSGIFSTYYVGEYYFRKGVTVGSVLNSLFSNNVPKYEKSDAYKFVYDSMGFASTGTANEYQSKIVEAREVDIDLSKNWEIFINDIECNINKVEDNEISAKFTNAFYNKNKELILEDTLNVSIVFHKKTFEIYLTTNGGDDAVKYWNTYLNKNGFVLELKTATINSNDLVIDSLPDLLEFKCEDGSIYYFTTGSELTHFILDTEDETSTEKVKVWNKTTVLKIPEGVESIKQFSSCEKLQIIYFPSTLKSLDSLTFYSIEIVGIGTVIESSKVPNLTTIYISKNTKIEKNCFAKCSTLSNIYFDGNIADWTISKASDISSSVQITVHCNDGNIII